MEDLVFSCTCHSWTSAHRADCPLNSRNRYGKRELFRRAIDQRETLQLGQYCAIHRSHMRKKHLVCRVVQVHDNRYRLYCPSGILSEGFSSSDLKTCPKKGDIPLHKWRQSHVVSVRDIPNRDLDECLCGAGKHSTRDYINVDDDGAEQADHVWIRNPLYTLSKEDRETIARPNGWLRDSVIEASQLLLLQDHP